MKSLLSALQEGRLIELPDIPKNKALEYLAALIEAIPDIGVEGGITESVLAREQAHNTGIGQGWACPHARSPRDGELVCSVGWSPAGIDYGAPDGASVHLLVMFFVPDGQKNSYLKEISLLAKSIKTQPALRNLISLTDLAEVRDCLLDAISIALESTTPDSRARMIQLEVKHAAAAQQAGFGLPSEIVRSLVPLSVLVIPGVKPIVLCQDCDMVATLEANEHLAAHLMEKGGAEQNGVQVFLRSYSNYQPDRILYDCLAFRAANSNSRPA
jgi:nitrogen PTS system EIIA component